VIAEGDIKSIASIGGICVQCSHGTSYVGVPCSQKRSMRPRRRGGRSRFLGRKFGREADNFEEEYESIMY